MPSPDTGDAPAPTPTPAPVPDADAGRTKRSTRSTTTVDDPSSTNQRASYTSVKARTVNGLKRLALYTKSPLADMEHCEERLNFFEYAYDANNTQIHSRSEREKVKTIPNTFKEAIRLPEANMWEAASDREMKSLLDLKVYTLVPRSEVPPGQEVIGSKWVYLQGERREHAQGAFGGEGVEPSARQGLRRNLCYRLQISEHSHGACHRRLEEQGGSPTRLENCIPVRGHRRGCVCRDGAWLRDYEQERSSTRGEAGKESLRASSKPPKLVENH